MTFADHAGAVHAPARPNGLVVVLCGSVGREARCSYRALWALANRLAEAGVTVLRYDHRGTGDSLPLDADADQWDAWRQGVRQAAAFARSDLGAERLVLAGLRLGATLAALEAEAAAADGVILLAPAESGRAWLREQQFAAGMLRGRAEPGKVGWPVELDGLRLSGVTADALRRTDLHRQCRPRAEVLVARPDGVAPAWLPAAASVPFDGYEALFQEAHSSAPPGRLFEQIVAWTGGLAPPQACRASSRLREPVLATAGWTERAVDLGGGRQAVLCLPAGGGARRGLIVGNTGGDPRAGVGGFAAEACRALASRGVAALRLDFAGLGESDGCASGVPTHVYEVDRKADFAAAADRLEAEGCREIFLAGVCSGAHHALHAGLASRRYAGVLAINTARLVWRPGDALALPEAETPTPRRLRWSDLRRRDLWRRLLGGGTKLRPLLRAQLAAAWRATRRPRDRQTRALCAAVVRFSKRGGQARLVVGRQDPAHRELEACFGWDGQRVAGLPGIEVRVLPDLDHGLFFSDSRRQALAEVLDFVAGPTGDALRARAASRAPAPATPGILPHAA